MFQLHTISITRLHDLLSVKVGKDTAETVTTDNSKMLATKEDVANNKAEIIKWMFIFWVGQVAVTFGFIVLFFKK